MEKSLLPLIFKEMEIQVLKNMWIQVFCYLIFHIYQKIYFLTNFFLNAYHTHVNDYSGNPLSERLIYWGCNPHKEMKITYS